MVAREEPARSPVDSDAIRRRVQREYLVMSAPAVFDARTADVMVAVLLDGAGDADVVVDLRDVRVCDAAVVDVLARAARELRATGATLTLSHPSPPVEEVLARGDGARALAVRRPRSRRPLRHSMRGDV